MTQRKVVITGMGVISAIGLSKSEFWTNLLAGQTGVDTIRSFDASSFPTQIAAEVKNFEPAQRLTARQVRAFSRASQFACAATLEARKDAQLEHLDPYRTDVIIGSSISDLKLTEEEIIKRPEGIQNYVGVDDPSAMFKATIGSPAAAVSLLLKTDGYVSTISSACTSAVNAVGLGAMRIRAGEADVVFCGGVDTPISRMLLTSFCAANFLTTNNDPKEALCPFDERHTKSVLAEGAGIFVLESEEHAMSRGSKPYAEILSFAQSTENNNELFMPKPNGAGWARNIKHALSRVQQRSIDYICAHSPSDKKLDVVESNALKLSFGPKLNKANVSSIKGAVGGNFTAPGAFQIATGALAIQTKTIPPNYNYQFPAPGCELNIARTKKKVNRIDAALINTRGIGSYNSALVLGRFKA